jgi:8-oxo-dGTP diphosphatase
MLKLATLCYIQKEDETLMLHRTKKENDMHEGKWNGIGGKFESGESPEECAQREILEETGLTAHKLVLKGFLTFPQLNGEDDWYVFVFVIPEWSGELIESTEGDLAWQKTAKLTELPLWEGDKYFLPKLSEKGFFTGKFCYNKDILLSYELMDY